MAVTFKSNAWGARAGDKNITEESGILTNLLLGDIVLVDRGFNTEGSVGLHCACVLKLQGTKGKTQLSPYEVAKNKKNRKCTHSVERVIGLLRNKYLILQSKALTLE